MSTTWRAPVPVALVGSTMEYATFDALFAADEIGAMSGSS
jgi:hypothetical protein